MTFPITGVFTSHWNSDGPKPPIDWPKVKAAGFTYAWIKATDYWDGQHRTDIRFERDWDLAQASGLLVGSMLYHRPHRPPDGQADYHLELLSRVGYGQLPHMADIEEDPHPSRNFISDLRHLISDLANSPLGHVCLYSNFDRLQRFSLPQAMKPATSLSVAYWTSLPQLPSLPFPLSTWHDWQWNCKANRFRQPKVPGISGDVCLHRFNGDSSSFLKWIDTATIPSPTFPVTLSQAERAAVLSLARKLDPP